MAALLLVDFADEWCTFLPAASIDAIRLDLGLSLTEAGAVLVALPAGGLVGNAFTLAADFVSRRALAACGALAYGAAMIGFGTGRSFAVLVVSAFAWGAASDAFVHGTQLALADLAGDELEPTLARTNLIASVGTFLAPVCVAAAEVVGIGWRPLVVGGGVGMLGYAAWLGTLRLPPPPASDHATTPWSAIRAVAADRWVRALAVVNATENVLDYSLLGFLILFLVERRGFSGAGATATVAVALAGATVGFAALAARPPPWSSRSVFVVTSLGRLAGLAVLLVVPHPVVIAATAFGFGVAAALHWVSLQAAMLRARPGQTGTTRAVIATLSLPELAAPPLIGAAADRLGLTFGLALYAVFPLLVLALLTMRNLGAWASSVWSRSRPSSVTSSARSRRPTL